jgi:hypothetical protein
MIFMSLNKIWEWIVGAALAPLGMMFVNAGEYISIIILLVLVDFAIGWIVNGWIFAEKWSWSKFLKSVPFKIIVACLLFPVLLNAQLKFNFLFDATKYVAMTFSIALIASMLDNAGHVFGVDIKEAVISKIKSFIPK